MNIGDYVRTQNRIFKITKINDEYIGIDGTEYKLHYGKMTKDYYFLLDNYDDFEAQTIYKSSPNIIDLLEVGDYVNGRQVFKPNNIRWLYVDNGEWVDDIKSIVTKEQFKSIEYKVE